MASPGVAQLTLTSFFHRSNTTGAFAQHSKDGAAPPSSRSIETSKQLVGNVPSASKRKSDTGETSKQSHAHSTKSKNSTTSTKSKRKRKRSEHRESIGQRVTDHDKDIGEDIAETDNEEEEDEDDQTEEDAAFINDNEDDHEDDHEDDGMQQVRCDQDTNSVNDGQDELTLFTEAVQMVKRPRGRPRKNKQDDEDGVQKQTKKRGRPRKIMGDEEGDDGVEKKERKRTDRRQLEVTCERGIGNARRSVGDYHLKRPFHIPLSYFITVWELQPGRVEMDFGPEAGKLGRGAFGNEAHRRWVNDVRVQADFASTFYVPISENIPLRRVSTDVLNTPVNPESCRTNSTSKVLHGFRAMHPQTELDMIQDRFYEKVMIGQQRTSRELRQEIDSGPFGGLQGKPVDVLWRVYSGEEVTNISEPTLQLVQAIAMALQGSKGDELWCMVRTAATDFYVRGKSGMSKVQSGVHTTREYNFHEAAMHSGRCAVDDIDERISKKVWRYRFPNTEVPMDNKEELSKLVHSRFKSNCPNLATEKIDVQAQPPTIDPVIVDLWVYKDIFTAWDEKTQQKTNVSVEGIYILAKCAPCDPLVILKSIAENNPMASTLLLSTFSHMLQVLGMESCSWDKLFSTDRAGASSVVSEARMLEGIFKFCDANSLRNVNVGGFRMDVKNASEMKMWDTYINTITSSRRVHYEILTRETIHDRKSIKDAQMPMENFALDIVHGVINWKVSVSRVRKEMEDYANTYVDEEEHEHVKKELEDWFSSHHFHDDGEAGLGIYPKYMFIPEGVGFALNTGIWIKIRTDNHKSHDDEKQEQAKKGKIEQITCFPQPQQQNNMVRLWCSNMSELNDPLDEVFGQSFLVPDLKWMVEEMPKIETVGESMLMLREMVGEEVHVSGVRADIGANLRLREILLLTGKERNPLRDRLDNLEDNTNLKYVFRAKMNKISASIKQTLQIMRSSEMLQWRIAAMGVSDLVKQSKTSKEKWVKDYQHVRAVSQFVDMSSWHDLLCSGTLSSVFYMTSNNRIDSDLSYMNTMLQRLMMLCFMAHNMNTPGAYGMTLRVGDVACSVNVLKEPDSKSGSKNTTIWLYDPKHPGMGIDQCTGNLGQQCNAAMCHISLTKDHRDLACVAVDTSLKNVSKMSYATLQGSGVLVNSSGDIIAGNTEFTRKCGKCCFFSEYGKQADDNVMMGWMESLMAHSGDQELGGESGVQQGSWQTTQNCDNLTVLPIKKMPILLITGNRPAPATPASAIEGARWINIPSSTMDRDNGFYIVALRDIARSVNPNVPGVFRADDSTISQASLTNSMSRGDVRKDIKVIKREVVLRNRLHFLLMQWLKTDAVLLCSAMTCDPKSFAYTMMSNFSNLECSVAQLTAGLRREYLNKDARFWHRNAVGPWDRVMQTSMHVYMGMSTSLLWSMDRVEKMGWPVDLHLAYELGIKTILTHNIPFLAMICSLHIWLASAVLDINVMIMACYVYHFTGFQHTCSLRVLSLAIIGELKAPGPKQEDEDWTAYLAFCEFIAPSVLVKRMGMRNPIDRGPRNVKKGLLSIPSYDTLQTWASWFLPALQNDITTAHASRTQGPEQEKLSVYCRPRVKFISKQSIKGFGRSKDGQHYTQDENISGTTARALATMFAREQKQSAHAQRCTPNSGQIIEEHENTFEFWNKVQAGTALPKASTSTNDVFKINFEYVPYTGIWWDETMQNAGVCDGLMKLFLLQSKLSPKITHFEFFERLMAPYLLHISSDDTVYGGPTMRGIHKNAWDSCVLDKLKVFEFSSKPSIDQQGGNNGIDVSLCMRLTHYVLFQGLGITTSWDKKQHENSSFVSCVHLRNMSSMSLGCLSILLHTCCDKAMIPANGGQLRLPVPSPFFEDKNEAQVRYDHRLHVDTHHHKMEGRSDNMLCVSARIATNSNWSLVDFASGESALWYTHVLCDYPRMNQAQSRATLFPFPPEAVAHTAFMFDDFFLANRRHIEQLEKDAALQNDPHNENNKDMHSFTGNVFAEAMLCMGESIRLEDFQHKQPSLTECAIRDGREVPCVTCQFGFLFTISFTDGMLHLKQCSTTHSWEEVSRDRECKPFLPLPLRDEQEDGVSLPSAQFCHVFRHGLCLVQDTDGSLMVTVDVKHRDNCKRLPFYMFPVVHFPVLLMLEHSGWFNPTNGMLLHTLEYFQAKHYRVFYPRDCGEEWFSVYNPSVSILFAECKAAVPTICLHACFSCDNSADVLCFWAENDGTVAYFPSAQHMREQLANNTFMDTSMFVPSNGEESRMASSSYLMLEHTELGLVPVRYAQPHRDSDGERGLVADFWHLGPNNEKIHRTETFSMKFEHFKARLLPVGEESNTWHDNTDYVWGIVLENTSGSFLQDGCYSVSSMVSHPCAQKPEPVLMRMDFITMSRCMLVEGSEIWINVTPDVYQMLQQQAHEQGFKIMLPVTEHLHENMQGLRYLRGFYVLGGSMHNTTIESNFVRIICVIANKVHSKRTLEDDNAGPDSPVNQHVDNKNTRFVAFSLPVLEHNGACIITRDRNDDTPFYKYLRESRI